MSFADQHQSVPGPSASYGSYSVYPSSSSDATADDAHLHATLQRIDQIANEDVEMQDPFADQTAVLTVDTNILLHHLDVLQHFVADVEAARLPVIVLIPGAVIYELDGQKNRDGLAWFARRASAWLLKKVKEKRSVRGQANEETCKASGSWKVRDAGEDYGLERANDALIVDCCRYYGRSARTFLCSADRNLCLEAESAGVATVTPGKQWSSWELARAIFGGGVPRARFGGPHASYQAPAEDDHMEIDGEGVPAVVVPSHALDLLHLQVIDHFTRLLGELAGRVGGGAVQRAGAGASQHAPGWARKGLGEWSAAECVAFLGSRRAQARTSPALAVFLSRPYSGGGRRGQDWSRRDWDVALGALAGLGAGWADGAIGESLRVLRPHLDAVWRSKMRPTGI